MKKNKLNLFLDMDGVLVNFTQGCKEIFSHIWPGDSVDPSKDMREHLGISNKEFWSIIDKEGEYWWANLQSEEWHRELISIIKEYDPEFTVLTSPSLSHHAGSGKILWLQRYFRSKWFTNYIITPAKNKSLLAYVPNAVLIDDNDKNCSDFIENGGKAILFPRINNKNYLLEDKKLIYLKEELDKLSKIL